MNQQSPDYSCGSSPNQASLFPFAEPPSKRKSPLHNPYAKGYSSSDSDLRTPENRQSHDYSSGSSSRNKRKFPCHNPYATGYSSTPKTKKSPSCRNPYNARRLIFDKDEKIIGSGSNPDERTKSRQEEEHHRTISFQEELELASQFGGITEAFDNLSLECSRTSVDEYQKKAISLAAEGKNLFLTGKAGTGKSWTVKQIVAACEANNKKIELTAATGIAAINIGGRTLNSWGGFRLGKHYQDFDGMMNSRIKDRVRETDVLLIDEISMVNGHRLDVLECMVAIVRCYKDVKERLTNLKKASDDPIVTPAVLGMRWRDHVDGGLSNIPPWGGLQLIVVGDFFQLPPIPNSDCDLHDEDDESLRIGQQGCYAFESRIWQRSELHTVELHVVHRQASDKDGLFELLGDMRKGRLDSIVGKKHQTAVRLLESPLPERDDGIVPTELHARNNNVDRVNDNKLDALSGDPYHYESLDEVALDPRYKTRLLSKHGLLNYEYMPYLFASVEAPPVPPALQEARLDLELLEKHKGELKAKEDYEALIAMRSELNESKQKVETLEKEEKERITISVLSITKYLNQTFRNDEDPEILFQKFQDFDRHLQRDFCALKEHAKKRFFQSDCRVKQKIKLKEDSQVMLLWNLDVTDKLANGSRGVIKGFVPVATYRCLLGLKVQEQEQIEIVHMEPQTGENSGTQEDSVFEKTNFNTGDNLHSIDYELKDDDDTSIKPEILAELRQHAKKLSMSTTRMAEEQRAIEQASRAGMTALPFVQFTNGKQRLILPLPFKREFRGCGHASRWQIPLCLAWAISIHKSQGMTISWLHVDLKDCFADGQAYVACSRGENLNSMMVSNWSIDEIKTSESVKQFYKSLDGRCGPYTKTWSDTITGFNQRWKLKKEYERRYKDRRCDHCGAPCNVKLVRKKNHNEGRFFFNCSNNHFEWIL